MSFQCDCLGIHSVQKNMTICCHVLSP